MPIYFRSAIFAVMLAFPVFASAQAAPEAAKVSPTDNAPSIPEGAFACPNGQALLLNQQPNQSNGIFADSDCALCGTGEQSVADDFVLSSASDIGQLVFWGGYFPDDQIPMPADPVNVIFHQDAAGVPGAVIDAQNLVPTSATLTGTMLFGVSEIMYVVDIAPISLPAGTYWVEIFTNSVGNTDSFFWEVGNLDAVNGRDGTTFAVQTPGETWTATPNQNFAFALCNESPGPRATFAVSKNFDDDNTAEVEVTLSCNTGLPLQQTTSISEGDPVNFVVVDFSDGEMDCTVTETGGVEGYSVNYFDGFSNSDEGCTFENIPFGGDFSCVIENQLDQVEVEVTKVWIDENPQFNAQNVAGASWSCSNVAFPCANGFANDCDNGNLDFFGNPGVDAFSVFPDWEDGTTCSITEVNVLESGIEVDDSECQGLVVSPGAGASCTIFNTRLFEGIPTLSQYGLGILALLMLGVGFVAFRRVI